MINSNIVNREIDKYGSSIILKTVTSSYNDYGDEDKTYVSNSIKAVVNIIGGESELVTEGKYTAGDKIFFVKGTITVKIGDVIVHSSNNYIIEEVLEGELNDTTYVKELRSKRE